MGSAGMNVNSSMAPLFPGLNFNLSPGVKPTNGPMIAMKSARLSLTTSNTTPSPVKSACFASASQGQFTPPLSSLNPGKRATTSIGRTSRAPSPSLMTSPKMWQKTSISRLAEDFFWIGGSLVAQPKWRMGQYVERCMCTMQTGTQMTKLKGKKKGLVRFFYLDEHKSCIRWRPSRKHDKAKITIDSIHEVCEGKKSEIFQRYAESRFDPNCCFSIYHGDRVKSLDLVSTNGDDARTWITGLKYLMAGISDEDSLAKRQRKRDQWLQQTFSEADKNGDGNLSLREVLKLLRKLNVKLPKQKVVEMFQKADTDDNQGLLAFEEFCTFYKMISTRRGLYLIMLSYSNNKEFMDLNDLVHFMENEQKMVGVTREYCMETISQFEPCPHNLQNMVLGIDGFTNYMRSPAGDIFNPEHHFVHQDMTQPLCNYFIDSSHNTYLTGDQLLSESRVDMYAYVLQAGCRCVEVDCWDGPDGEPIIHHGYTLTSKILFKDVIETINKYAFTKNPYPVILSIENHCTVPQQKKMAEYLVEVLQEKVDLSTVNMNETRKMPSPELLKGKVLIKGKKLPMNIDDDAEEGDVSDEDSGEEEEEDEEDTRISTDGSAAGTADESKPKKPQSIIGSFRRKRKRKKKKKHMLLPDHADQENPIVRDETQIVYYNRRGKTMRLSRALSDLVKYTKSVRVHDIETQAYMSSWQVSSLNESIVNQIMALKPAQLVRFNQRQLLRVYPSNYRVDSSNFNPQPFWNAGIHMVALNYQTEGRMLELNKAKFSTNGNCGYILKPKCMNQGFFNPNLEDPLPGQKKTQLVLKIISGQQLPKPKDSMLGDRGEVIDPSVEVEIIGLPVDCCKQQTRVVDDNGFNPMWEETMVFSLHMAQIALVRFQVWDNDSLGQKFIGQRTIAFISMMPGYRHVYLEGMEEASIFVHVAVHDVSGKVKSSNAVKGLLKKATTKGLLKEPKVVSADLSNYSSEDARQRYRKELDSNSQENSGNGSRLMIPAGLDCLQRGAQSEPVKRANRVKTLEEEIQSGCLKEQKGKEKSKGILFRMSSTISGSGASLPCINAKSPEPEDVFQLSHPKVPEPEDVFQLSHPKGPGPEDVFQLSHPKSPGPEDVFQLSHPKGPGPEDVFQLSHPKGPGPEDVFQLSHPKGPGPEDVFQLSHPKGPGPKDVFQLSHPKGPEPEDVFQLSHPKGPGPEDVFQLSHPKGPGPKDVFQLSHPKGPELEDVFQLSHPKGPGPEDVFQLSHPKGPEPEDVFQLSHPKGPGLEDVFQLSHPKGPEPERQIMLFQASWPHGEPQSESIHADCLGQEVQSESIHADCLCQDKPGQSFEPEWPDPLQIKDLAEEPKAITKPEPLAVSEPLNQPQALSHALPQALSHALPQALSHALPQALSHALPQAVPKPFPQTLPHSLPQPQALPHALPQPQALPHPEVILRTRRPPSSPVRVRRTLETIGSQVPSGTLQTKARSRSVPRKQHAFSMTPVADRRVAVHWQPRIPSPPLLQNHSSHGQPAKPIPNGLRLSDSDSSSSDSIDSLSLELLPSRVPVRGQREVGTLQREMNALFDQKMREIRCKSPLFFNDYSTL
ncbi:1-phosphatidylinositol 4,5-bisphosphate phosphodiesterase eta-2 [Esox lucius]|uniref:1-phosphatidylinositol 4,5-bisphosphate phosphodiesterase eta-2 n=1 Tax=Esox lucius TaxID=8010 RepID=UPI001476FFFA|nr:1-phosphatidylinositol 4,5-bisphosphate phosphodiesterase eta-2 [Esox lucius]